MRSDEQKGVHVLPRRWVVERTFAWLNHKLFRDAGIIVSKDLLPRRLPLSVFGQ